jgi:glycosyltransferase involved in cell wall biosynthesis
VAIVGPYPPPYGGVSVHIKRVHERLSTLGIRSRVFCQPSSTAGREPGVVPAALKFSWHAWIPEQGWRCRERIVHFHDGWYWGPAAALMLLFGKKVVMTLHDQETSGIRWSDASGFERWASRRLFRHPRVRWVAVSPKVNGQLIDMGVPADRILVAPAYVPPPSDTGTSGLPRTVRDFLAAHSPTLSSYAWKLTLDAQGVDVYGLDQCIELVHALRGQFPDIGLVISLPQVAEPAYFEQLNARVAALGLKDAVLFVTEPLDEVHQLWRASDVFVRATNTDGDAVTVREALNMRVPVVASDASPRPAGAVLYPTRNLPALIEAVRGVLADPGKIASELQAITIDDNFPPLLNLYRAIA